MLVAHLAPLIHRYLDVGANIGYWSESLLEKSGSENIRGILFEPSSSALVQLQQRFPSEPRLTIRPVAIGEAVGELTFAEEPGAGETSSLVTATSRKDAVIKTVPVSTIDTELEAATWDSVDFVKVDVEGYDYHAIRGAGESLKSQRIGILQFEYNQAWSECNSTLRGAIQYLETFGYVVYVLRHTGLHPFRYEHYGEYYRYSNYVAVAPHFVPRLQPLMKEAI